HAANRRRLSRATPPAVGFPPAGLGGWRGAEEAPGVPDADAPAAAEPLGTAAEPLGAADPLAEGAGVTDGSGANVQPALPALEHAATARARTQPSAAAPTNDRGRGSRTGRIASRQARFEAAVDLGQVTSGTAG